MRWRQETLGDDWEEVAAAPPPKKARPPSKMAMAVAGVDVDELDWADMVSSGEVAKLNMTQLKAYLRAHGQAMGGKKAELVDRVKAHVEETGGGTAGARPAAGESGLFLIQPRNTVSPPRLCSSHR